MSENEPRHVLMYLAPALLERLESACPPGQSLAEFAAELLARELAAAAPVAEPRPALIVIEPDALPPA